MNADAFYKAVQPGFHGMLYEGTFRDFFLQPMQDQDVLSLDPAAQTIDLQVTRTIKTTHWPEERR